MKHVETVERPARLHVENVGGIDETEVELQPGVTVLTGRNASNRTSLMQALMAALGSDRASLKGDASEGYVELDLEEQTYSRTLERQDGEVVFGGEPYMTDPRAAEMFAFLLESNEARQGVARGQGLRDVIMEPVDTDAIETEIERLEARQREIESALADREQLSVEVTRLEQAIDDLEAKLERKRTAYSEKQAEIQEADAELGKSRERKGELESKLTTLQETRSELETVRHRLETETETAERVREELGEVESELGEVSGTSSEDDQQLDTEIEQLRERKRTLDSKINQLQSLVSFNEEMLDGEGIRDLDLLGSDADSDDHVTSRLLGDDSLVCWTCGQEATTDHVEQRLEELREARQALVRERSTVKTDLQDKRERQEDLERTERRRSELRSRRDTLEAELSDAESEIESLTERRDRLREELESIEETVEDLREDEYEEIITLHKEANELELGVSKLEDELEDEREELARARERLEDLESLEADLSEVEDQLRGARTRIERLETEATEAFNEHMDAVLEELGFDNLERIWIERVEREVREGRRTVTRSVFDLHVVRRTPEGTVYEDTVSHLSESEREVTGLVFALAGYLAHEVYETMPFVLLDSVEAIDAQRIAALLEYLDEYAQYLAVALLPEDASAVDDSYPEITDI